MTEGLRWKVTKAVRASSLPSPAKLIMLTLADISDVGTAEIPERFTPSLTVLARETSLGRSTVATHLLALEGEGWIVRTRPETAQALGRGERTRYQLKVPPHVPSPAHELPSAGDEPPSAAPEQPSAGAEQPSATAGHRDRSSSDLDQTNVRSSTPRKRGTRIPDDFAVTPEMTAWARENVPELAGKRETEKFINYWQAKAGKDATKVSWEKTWKNWMLTAAERLPNGGRSSGANRHIDQLTPEERKARNPLIGAVRASQVTGGTP